MQTGACREDSIELMSVALLQQITTALAQFSSATRLYALKLGDDGDEPGSGGLLVEAFCADDIVQGSGARDIIVLSTDAHIALAPLLGKPASLEVSLVDGSRTTFSGDITQAAMLGSEGGLARFRLRLTPWLWRLSQVRNSRVWQDKTVIEIVESVFAAYQPLAQWRWSEEVDSFLADVCARSYCCQYRESDYDFVLRLLTEEGLAWRFEETEDGLCLVLFADSSQLGAVPEDASSAAGGGIRFHGVRAGEQQDTIQALQARRSVTATLTTLLSYDYKARKAVAASAPAQQQYKKLPPLESYDVPGQYAYASGAQAQHYAELQMQAREARSQQWRGRSTVRTLAAGRRINVTQGPLAAADGAETPAYTVLRVTSVGVNNLPSPASHGLAELFGPIPELLEELAPAYDDDFALVIEQARKTGYANSFEAVAADVIWRPQRPDSDGRNHHKPTASGAQSAIVVGADGSDQPAGSDELHCDALGRVRIRYHWQDNGDATCWVRVAQRSAGGGMGSQFLPRVGQEVLVQFIENDIDRPIILGALYNGQGEGGVAPTPAGQAGGDSQAALFNPASDHAPSAQGNLAAGNSPLWHGASADTAGHGNAAAQWGLRSKEFGGSGYNQLMFDDTDAQGRVQLRSTHAASELTLGHLIHSADNYRGSLRGQGAELRTDAYGALRAGGGLLVSSYKIDHSASEREPMGDNTAGIALLKQAVQLGQTFSEAAKTHETVALATHIGAAKADASVMDDKSAPLKAMLTAVSGMVGNASLNAARADTEEKKTAPGDDQLPHASSPIIAVSGKGGLSVTAGQGMQLSNGETIALMSGADTQFASGGQLRAHSRQAIGVLGGAVKAGENNIGLQIIAAKDAIDVQAQADVLKVQARDEVNLVSANAFVDWAAAKSITLSTAGGANITIDGGNITVQCPGKITVRAGTKSFSGATSKTYSLPVMPVFIPAIVQDSRLESTFAFDQLTQVAQRFSKVEFVFLLVPIFGYDIPAETYIKLYEGLRAGSIPQPKLVLMTGCHYPAEFDNKKREIHVHKAAADRAATNRDESWELLTALLHEFGHYIDVVLRKDLAPKDEHGQSTLAEDAEGEEGAKFAYQIAFYDFEGSKETTYATYTSPRFSGDLKVNYVQVRDAIRKSQGADAQAKEGKDGDVEYFGAGMGEHHDKHPSSSFGHQSIERALGPASANFGPNVLKQIYFGNWLRDFSQILDPAIVRKPTEEKSFPEKISRAHLTRVVAVLAESEFVANAKDKELYKVTEKNLGVYRPVEHIDNPTNNDPHAPNPQTIDKDFQPLPDKAYLSVDPAVSMKRYIAASRDFMKAEIDKAVAAGPVLAGFMSFGAALHVLEDYFAHSNFVELSLRKLGYSKVLPWTSAAPGKHKYPVVTGMFDKDDVIASTAGMIAETLFKVEWEFKASEPFKRTKAQKIALILLEEQRDSRYLTAYKFFLGVGDKWSSLPGHQYPEGAMHYTLGMVGNSTNMVFSTLIQLMGNSVDDEQVVRVGDPNTSGSTDPSHSQLAKDHDNHPFHTLAAQLAMKAVQDVGRAMAQRWWNEPGVARSPSAVAAAYLVHPEDTGWQDELVKKWAETHARELIRGESSTEWAALEKAHKKEVLDMLEKMNSDSKKRWDYINKNFDELFGKGKAGK
ncbi:heterokaryon incompatibility protein Het-C [Duganella sp. HH101]|nr:heterokaryon incompatibility protein Het-C [Duganella sp. HH101]